MKVTGKPKKFQKDLQMCPLVQDQDLEDLTSISHNHNKMN